MVRTRSIIPPLNRNEFLKDVLSARNTLPMLGKMPFEFVIRFGSMTPGPYILNEIDRAPFSNATAIKG
jgi:hypothetical protein